MADTAIPLAPAPSAPPAAAAPSAPVSSPVESAPIQTYTEPITAPDSVQNEMNALIDSDSGAPDLHDMETPPDVAAPPPVEAKPDTPAETELAEEHPANEEQPPVAVTPELPEGVKVRTIDGKPRWVIDPEAGKSAFARSALVDQAEQILGEPLTKEALEHRQRTVEGLEGMRGDLLSDKPEDQGHVVDHFADIIQKARDAGEIGHDALSGLVKITIDKALASQDPALQRSIQEHVTRKVADDIYADALAVEDKDLAEALWNSAANIDKRSFGTYRTLAEFQKLRTERPAGGSARFQKPPASATAPTAAPASNQNNAYREWESSANNGIHKDAVIKPIDTALESVVPKEHREKYPNNFKSLRDQLASVVRQGFREDHALQDQVETIRKRASVAVNPQIRNQLQQEIVRRHASKAEQILREKKGPILTEFAQLLSAKSNDTANRLQAGQRSGHQAPPSGGPSSARTLAPTPSTGKFGNTADFQKELEGALT